MRLLLSILLSFSLLTSPLFGQSEKPQTIIVPTGSLGEISEVRKKMLEKTLESKLDDYFDIVPKELFEEAQEKAFEELDYEECTEDQCIVMIKEILQVENSFQLILMEEEGDTQISLTWNDLDKKRVEEEYCEGCKTKELRKTIADLVDKLVGIKSEKMLVRKNNKLNSEFKQIIIATGDEGIVISSNDLKKWVQRLKKNGFDFTSSIFNKGEFKLVGEKGVSAKSKDGIFFLLNTSPEYPVITSIFSVHSFRTKLFQCCLLDDFSLSSSNGFGSMVKIFPSIL